MPACIPLVILGVLLSLNTAAWGDTGGKRTVSADLVDITNVVPGIVVSMRYASADNFTGKTIYDCNRCFLAGRTAQKLAIAQTELQKLGLGLKIWDCYRPLAVQKMFWSLVPDARFVADPGKGSRHNRGTAVDATLVDAEGEELRMPTTFDDFSPRASHDNDDLPDNLIGNRRVLAKAMKKAGFQPIVSEWWHYDDSDWRTSELLDIPFKDLCRED